jgi:cytochrome c553
MPFTSASRRIPSLTVCGLILACLAECLLRANAAAEGAFQPPATGAVSERPTPALYAKFCAKCHNADGAGSKPCTAGVPDFTRATWQRENSDIQLQVSIREGKGKIMPGFADRLSDGEVIDLVAHIRTFAPVKPPAEPKARRTDFDERFRMLEGELEELQREFWRLHRASEKKKP